MKPLDLRPSAPRLLARPAGWAPILVGALCLFSCGTSRVASSPDAGPSDGSSADTPTRDGARPDRAGADSLDGLTVVGGALAGTPIAGLPEEWLARFDRGDRLFDQAYSAAQGLGPVYIRPACNSCHAEDARGPGTVTKMVIVEADGITQAADQSALPYGHTVRPQVTAGASQGITVPEGVDGLKVSMRLPPAVFGRGYMEAIADEEIERVEAEQQARADAIHGRINRVTFVSEANPDQPFHDFQKGQSNLIGRFGLKARQPSLDDFAADAFQGDMGLTSPMRPDELPNPDQLTDDAKPGIDLDLDTINRVADYMRLLAIPERQAADPRGRELFEQVQCSVCHVPSLRTRADYPIPALAGIDAPVYTDLLLHDMGPDLADGLDDQSATGSEWRTAPLIGVRLLRAYLHDGRAKTVEQAIEQHGGQAAASVQAFQGLSDGDRASLIEFVKSL